MVPTGHGERAPAAVLPGMTEIAENETTESAATEGDTATIPAQRELRVGVGALMGRLSAGKTA